MKTLIPFLTLTLILSACRENRVGVQGQQTSPSITPSPATGKEVTTAEFSPDGHRIMVASKDGTVRIWDAQTGQALSGTNGPIHVWDPAGTKTVLPRYNADAPDRMPIIGGDNFKLLQDQIDALQNRVQELEKKANTPGR